MHLTTELWNACSRKKKKSEFKEKIDNFTIIDGDFNTLSSEVDRIISGPYVEKGHYDSP